MIDKLEANSRMVVEQMSKIGSPDFGYDAASVEFLDGFIERQRVRDDIDEQFIDGMVNTLGSYLGQSIITSYGGSWARVNDSWVVQFDSKNCAFPFAKVRKQFQSGRGSGESVKGFFDSIPAAFAKFLSPPKKPWWKFW